MQNMSGSEHTNKMFSCFPPLFIKVQIFLVVSVLAHKNCIMRR